MYNYEWKGEFQVLYDFLKWKVTSGLKQPIIEVDRLYHAVCLPGAARYAIYSGVFRRHLLKQVMLHACRRPLGEVGVTCT